ncbi:MAG: anaphase-promoting complex subunit cdc27 [Cirrosporium novae-zelandiae]|nr:MAG: anaphase-promoting complex subunit cdc27 [Cirrosporium novae-zelandiae]
MSPPNLHIVSQLRQLIYYHLDNHLLRNALFFAGRLHAYEPRSSEAAYLLALCYFLNGQLKAAYDYSRNSGSRGTHLGCSYVFAQSCLGLERYGEGLTALDRSRGLWASKNNWNKHSESRRQHLPDAASVYCLQGKLLQAHDDFNKAVDSYIESLKLNPFMWDAFICLCDLGVHVRVPNIFRPSPEMLTVLSGSAHGLETHSDSNEDQMNANGPLQVNSNKITTNQLPSNDVFGPSDGKSKALFEKLNGSRVSVASLNSTEGRTLETPTALRNEIHEVPNMRIPEGEPVNISTQSWEPPAVPRKGRAAHRLGVDLAAEAPPKMATSSLKSRLRNRGESEETDASAVTRVANGLVGDRKRTISGQAAQATAHAAEVAAPQRRSVRLFNQIRPSSKASAASMTANMNTKEGRELRKARATGTKGRTGTSTVGRVVSGNRNLLDHMDIDAKEPRQASVASTTMTTASQRAQHAEKMKEQEALHWLLELFNKLGSGYFTLQHYQCQEAIQIFQTVSQGQRETPWVLAHIGRAYYEQASYNEAEKYFIRIRTIAPSLVDDMEVYSTVLWHLKNDVELAFLAHELIEIDRLSPEAWCTIGNCFSLQRDHDNALKCFKRATQLDPKFAYAFTLQGHEYVANEEYDRALEAYRNGITADKRHYNAWYGLGKVYEKMGKYGMAEQHFRTAANINPTNAVLVCCIGMVLEKMNNPKAAYLQYAKACELAPRSQLARFKKARVMMALQEPKLALEELKILKDIAPDEANVHFLLGRLYKMLHDKANAIKHFTTALNLDPRAAAFIKEAMESLEDDMIEEDDEGEIS